MNRVLALSLTFALACGGSQSPASERGNESSERNSIRERPAARTFESIDSIEPLENGERLPTAAERRDIAILVQAAERARNLKLLKELNVKIQSAERITQALTEEIKEEDTQKTKDIYETLGLIPKGTDVVDMLSKVVGEQVVGYYNTKNKLLVIRQDVIEKQGGLLSNPQTRMTMVHEITHALQDQHLGLKEMKDEESDRTSAYKSVIEGDATLAMIVDMLKQSGVEPNGVMLKTIVAQVGQSAAKGSPELASAPAILRATLTFPYTAGLHLCADAYSDGGWDAIDQMHRHPPEETRMLIEKTSQPGVSLEKAVNFGFLKKAGFAVSDSDKLGTLETSIYLAHGADADRDDAAAAGLVADRLQVWKKDNETVVSWVLRWKSPASAQKALVAAKRHPDTGVVRKLYGSDMLILHGLPPKLHSALPKR